MNSANTNARAGGLQPPRTPKDSPHPPAPEISQPNARELRPDGGCKPPAQDTPAPESVFFDKDAPVRRYRNWLPHWRQRGKWYFVTFRLADSLAQSRLDEWMAERAQWLKLHPQPWSEKTDTEYHRRFTTRFENWLDAGEGNCWLRNEAARASVVSALNFFAAPQKEKRDSTPLVCAGGLQPPPPAKAAPTIPSPNSATIAESKPSPAEVRYELGDFVVMPNHVHILVRPLATWTLEKILHSWKTFTAKQINACIGRRGSVWWKDSFDHIVRSGTHFAKFQRYITNNPIKARLQPHEFHLHRTNLNFLHTAP